MKKYLLPLILIIFLSFQIGASATAWEVDTKLIQHETCKEYLKRRLSEGWKCISLEGYDAVLLSPEGIRRELDLRNDIETLRPSAAGDETNLVIAGDVPAATNWESVDEAIADDTTTYVYTDAGETWQRDLYSLPVSAGSGTINFIKVYFRCKWFNQSTEQQAKPSLKSDSTVTDGDAVEITSSFVTYSQQWNTNPASEPDLWTWSDIDDLQIGVNLYTLIASRTAQCTQVYVEVDYTPPPEVNVIFFSTPY